MMLVMTMAMSRLLPITALLLLHIVLTVCHSHHVHRFQRKAKEQRRLSDARLERYLRDGASLTTNCPCESPRSISTIQESSGKVLGFADLSSTGESYNFTHISTVAWASPKLACRAHCHGARALMASPSFALVPDLNTTKWVHEVLNMTQSFHYDGIVFDYELPVTRREAQTYVQLVRATKSAFSKHNLLVITCVAWSPDGIDGRNYPVVALARASDYLYVMDYDTQSQIFAGPCIANANAPFAGMVRGIERYLQLGIDRRKLILGVPWYGYRYPCLNGTKSDARYCPIPLVPFRGINCSDAAGIEVPYRTILGVHRNMTATDIKRTGGVRRDEYMDAAFMNHVTDNGTVYQYWFDDSTSIRNKFEWAKFMGLGGVGPYTFDYLDPIEFPEESREMWSAFDAFCSVHAEEEEEAAKKLKEGAGNLQMAQQEIEARRLRGPNKAETGVGNIDDCSSIDIIVENGVPGRGV